MWALSKSSGKLNRMTDLEQLQQAESNSARQQQLTDWVNSVLAELLLDSTTPQPLEVVSGDASFRRYFRVAVDKKVFIAVDAPPKHEDSRVFVRNSSLLLQAGINAPKVYSVDYVNGFMLLEDFGNDLYLPHLLEAQQSKELDFAESLYRDAIGSLILLQKNVDSGILDPYDREQLQGELVLFVDWFCIALLEINISDKDRICIEKSFSFLTDAALSQPQIAVHRDYHSRNLMILDKAIYSEGSGPGVIDFQDAMRGAYTYDLVSLLRDCYISWQPNLIDKWSGIYFDAAKSNGIIQEISLGQFSRDIDLMGLQRHIKVMGIFARLCIRDNKPQFLADIPMVIRYFLEVGEKYEELAPFLGWFKQTVFPVAKRVLKLES
jgi:aminoglycoside/choline kinase family phosphotransferase